MARKLKKKGQSGAAAVYISRKQALKKLQLSLKDFRRLCILKGIYPVEPKNKKKVAHGSSSIKTYFHLKDIQFLAHEPIIEKFRDLKVFLKRLRKAIGKRDSEAADRVRGNYPTYRLDHIVKERYPTFVDSLRDVDDALTMCFLFATFPKSKTVKSELIQLCRRLTIEFMHYVIESQSLRKVFISIKGYYYQAEIMGQVVNWVVPHPLAFQCPNDVDFKIMVTFTEFYSTMLGFINYRLYHSLNLFYPPKLQNVSEMKDYKEDDPSEVSEWVTSLNHTLKSAGVISEDEAQPDEFPNTEDQEAFKAARHEEERLKKLKSLFSGLKFFLNREVPRESLVFIIRAFGGQVSWDKTVFPGATFDEKDETITHHIIDRPAVANQYLNRYYIQPQWVYDSINASLLVPVQDYFPGVELPAHLSPFVEEKEGDYVPPEKQTLIGMQRGLSYGPRMEESEGDDFSEEEDNGNVIEEDEEVEKKMKPKGNKRRLGASEKGNQVEMKVRKGQAIPEDHDLRTAKEAAEEKRLAVMMIPKKKRYLYQKIMYGKRRTIREAEKMKSKREDYEKQRKVKQKTAS